MPIAGISSSDFYLWQSLLFPTYCGNTTDNIRYILSVFKVIGSDGHFMMVLNLQ